MHQSFGSCARAAALLLPLAFVSAGCGEPPATRATAPSSMEIDRRLPPPRVITRQLVVRVPPDAIGEPEDRRFAPGASSCRPDPGKNQFARTPDDSGRLAPAAGAIAPALPASIRTLARWPPPPIVDPTPEVPAAFTPATESHVTAAISGGAMASFAPSPATPRVNPAMAALPLPRAEM